MNETKAFASLSPGLLARKGAARPAMRSQLHAMPFERADGGDYPHSVPSAPEAVPDHHDLGWNDIAGEDVAAAPQPEVLRQIETLADAMRVPETVKTAAKVEAPAPPLPQRARRSGSALLEGRKAAFTLRLDGNRHLRLRLACAVENRSAQQFVTEALDLFLETMPGLEDLARRARQS